MAEYGKSGGRWEYAQKSTPTTAVVHKATMTEKVLATLVSLITVALFVALIALALGLI